MPNSFRLVLLELLNLENWETWAPYAYFVSILQIADSYRWTPSVICIRYFAIGGYRYTVEKENFAMIQKVISEMWRPIVWGTTHGVVENTPLLTHLTVDGRMHHCALHSPLVVREEDKCSSQLMLIIKTNSTRVDRPEGNVGDVSIRTPLAWSSGPNITNSNLSFTSCCRSTVPWRKFLGGKEWFCKQITSRCHNLHVYYFDDGN